MTEIAQETTVDTTEETTTPDAENAPDEIGTGSEAPRGNREARYRVERNEAREALAAAQARIDGLLTAEVHHLADELAQPSDLFEVGQVTLVDLLDEAGNIDSEAVAESVAALIADRPGLAKHPRQPVYDPHQGLGNSQVRPEVSWGSFLSAE
ncbi:hypothetical protein KN246_21080 [Mycobacterium intracellulare]|uniref:hypothetical protein n=1 Tax=Mycobacterium intracellulare TaxID=1767 RepID=UPI0005A140F0|nr:hypothetical protein [Mycobacterium intracellulare]MDM3898712.1 hypothetical protein [Mycobacterium intracellulare]UGT95794.1 hypothetical protein LTQ55_19020 [Mycobacterium intracellulare]UQB96662.1 hypothetical protein KN246_21080 [Mycobacterium intracellulare]